jgi:hypothetical protein
MQQEQSRRLDTALDVLCIEQRLFRHNCAILDDFG